MPLSNLLSFYLYLPVPRITGTPYPDFQDLLMLKCFIVLFSKTSSTFGAKTVFILDMTFNATQSWSSFKPMSAVHHSPLSSISMYVKARQEAFQVCMSWLGLSILPNVGLFSTLLKDLMFHSDAQTKNLPIFPHISLHPIC